jgi:hypothetical protein
MLCVPKRNPIALASFMIEPYYTNAINYENDINHEVKLPRQRRALSIKRLKGAGKP